MKLFGIVGTNSADSNTTILLEFMKNRYHDDAEIELIRMHVFLTRTATRFRGCLLPEK